MGFQGSITALIDLLKPIHEMQKMLEDNHATIGYVYLRQIRLEAHLKKIANSNSIFAINIKAYLETVAIPSGSKLDKLEKKNQTRRREKQLLPIHKVAYYLDPKNSKAPY